MTPIPAFQFTPSDPIAAGMPQELERTRQEYHALVESVHSADWRQKTTHPDWLVSDVLYHMILALKYLPEDVRLVRRFSRFPPLPGFIFHRWNDWNTKRGGRKSTPTSLINDYDSAHNRLISLLGSIQPDEWSKGLNYPGWDPMLDGFVSVEMLFHYPTRHFTAHRDELKHPLDIVAN